VCSFHSPENQTKQELKQKSGFLATINHYLRYRRIGDMLIDTGKLTTSELELALKQQKSKNTPLGEILVELGLVSKRELQFALISQSTLKTVLAIVTLITCTTSLSSRQVQASNLKEIPQSISVAFTNVSAAITSGEAIRPAPLFGTGETVSRDLSSFTKWSSMFDRFSREVNSNSSSAVIQKWKQDISHLQGLPLYDMANEVNRVVNKIRYIGDKKNWGKSDYWATPIEFLTYGGDCEDFAITKYISLRMLGVPDRAMRVAIVKDLEKGIPHAILIVYTDKGPMVLDNQIKQMTDTASIDHYKPIFSINRSAWWLHNGGKERLTQIASAAR
jgi:predicted transglutaminase-like cysteine proteinase